MFYTLRGEEIIVPYAAEGTEIFIPAEVSKWGGPSRFTVRGVEIDDLGYITTALAVTGTIVTTYTAGNNPRLVGKLTPNTIELYLSQAAQEMARQLTEAKASGLFDGADGQNGLNGQDGTPAGFGTPTATAHPLSQDAQPTVSVTASGEDTEKVFAFDFGIPVSVGKNFTILGHYDSIQQLRLSVLNPETGDAYSIGTTTPYNIYVYYKPTNAWQNYGPLGSGSAVIVDTAMSDSSENAVQNKIIKAYVDSQIPTIPTSLKNPYAVSIYGQSYDGSSAVTVTADDAMSSTSTKPAQNKVVKQYIDDALGDIQTAINAISAVIGNVAANNTSNESEDETA